MSNAAEQDFLASLDAEPGLLTQVRALFRGPVGKLAILAYAIAILAFLASLWAVKQMALAPSREAQLWFALAVACWTSLLTIKLWIWNRLNTLAVLRRLPR